MHRKVKFIVASFCLLPFFVLSEAYGNCGHFVVYFHNKTPFDCNVMHSKLHHGFWKRPLIKTIAPHNISSYMTEHAAFYGPDAEVTLRCGNKVKGYYDFTVRNQQNFCFVVGGDQKNTVVSKDKGINVTNVMVQHASVDGDQLGIAMVTVQLSP